VRLAGPVIGRLAAAVGLLLLAPICAEYLYGYDESTGDLNELVGGLLVFVPLYGGAALLIREATRRAGRGWPTILLLAAAFGVAEAGLIDSSIFNPAYRDIPYWDAMFRGSLIPGLDVNPNLALVFTVGHVIWSVAVPIALVEGLAVRRRTARWLGWVGLVVTALALLCAAAFVVWWHLDTMDFLPSAGQYFGAALVVAGLIVAAFRVPPRAKADVPAVNPWLAGLVAFAVIAAPTAVDAAVDTPAWQRADASWFLLGWAGLAVNIALLVLLGALLWRWSASRAWGTPHTVAVAAGLLLANVATAFPSTPIGDVTAAEKRAHNLVAAVGVLALVTLTAWRSRTPAPQAGPAPPAGPTPLADPSPRPGPRTPQRRSRS
jgi:hypothetical protein